MRISLVVIATIAAVIFTPTPPARADVAAAGGNAVAQTPTSDAQPPVAVPTPAAPLVKPVSPPRARTTAARSGNADCGWIGKRTVQVLVRDDLIAADGFFKFYDAFGCPVRHLSEAFSCTVDGLDGADARAVELRIEACWDDPAARLEPAQPASTGDAKADPNGGTADQKIDPGSLPPK